MSKPFSKNLPLPFRLSYSTLSYATVLTGDWPRWIGTHPWTWICQNTPGGKEIHPLPSAIYHNSPLASFLLHYIFLCMHVPSTTILLYFFFYTFSLKIKILFYQKYVYVYQVILKSNGTKSLIIKNSSHLPHLYPETATFHSFNYFFCFLLHIFE